MDAVSAYSFANLAWQGLQAGPLIIWPSFISSLLNPDYRHSSTLENYYARSLGLALLTIGLVVVVLSGAVPLTSSVDAPADVVSPYASAVVLLSALHSAAAAFYCYGRYLATGQTAYLAGTLGNVALAAFGLWCLLFAGDKTRLSKKHGFDKSTSGFPFKNAGSYRAKKKGL